MARRSIIAALLCALLTSVGCCSWCERHCGPRCAQYPPAPACATPCYPTNSYAPPPPNWNQPVGQVRPMNCQCTCTP